MYQRTYQGHKRQPAELGKILQIIYLIKVLYSQYVKNSNAQ